ncbi:MAG: hypothetical protein OXN21_16460, partial [Chloroflexota bacterium]|nr:hypothetical protein [Chloroflexota bacterium]
FWHNHEGCDRVRIPNTNRDYWVSKLERNSNRDKKNIVRLELSGWQSIVIWECQLKDMAATIQFLTQFLDNTKQCSVGEKHEH